MTDEKFNKAIDEIVGFIVDVQKLQMDQLKCNIKAVYEANTHEVDPHAIAKMIMNIPIEDLHTREIQFKCEGCTDYKGDHKIISADPCISIGEVGDLNDLSYVKVGNDVPFGKDFYHHCPERGNELIRLHCVNQDKVHVCPVCDQIFKEL